MKKDIRTIAQRTYDRNRWKPREDIAERARAEGFMDNELDRRDQLARIDADRDKAPLGVCSACGGSSETGTFLCHDCRRA